MSLLPLLFDDNFWAPYSQVPRPNRNLWEDVFQPLAVVNSVLESPHYLRDLKTALQQQNAPEVTFDTGKFQANFDVQHFKPGEISVKVSGDNTITVEAEHEEKQDEHGQIYRHFVRKYAIPKYCDMNRLESNLSSDGVLTISAPTVGDKEERRDIPIAKTGKPVRSVEEKKPENLPK